MQPETSRLTLYGKQESLGGMELFTADDIRARAKAVGLSIRALCQLANVPRSTFEGWDKKYQPNMAGYRRVVEALERAEAAKVPQDAAE